MANNFKKHIFLLALSASAAQVWAQSGNMPALSQERIEAIKRSAGSIGSNTNPQTIELDANGEPVRNADGTPKLKGASTFGGSTQLEYFNSVTGNQGARLSADGTQSQAFGATIASTGHVDFSCGDPSGKIKSVNGVQVKFLGCTSSTVNIGVCDRPKISASCDDASYFVEVGAPKGSFQTVSSPSGSGDITLGAGCNATTAVCRITVKAVDSLSGNSSTGIANGGGVAARSTEGSVASTISNRIQSNEFVDRIGQTADDIRGCVNRLDKQGVNGNITTCDGAKGTMVDAVAPASNPSGGASPTAANPDCKKDPVCKTQSTRVENFQTSCVRSSPLTTKACSVTIPSLTCKELRTGEIDCTTEQLAESVLVGTTEFACVETVQDPVLDSAGKPVLNADGTPQTTTRCTKEQRTNFYYFPTRATAPSCVATPLPLKIPEQCSDVAASELACPDSAIFGRTLGADQCSVVTSVLEPLFFNDKPGCGVCLKPTKGTSCLAEPTISNPDDTCTLPSDATCSLASTELHSGQNGLLDGQKETYNCRREISVCTEFEPAAACVGISTFGLNKAPVTKPDYGAFAKSLVSMSIVSGTAQTGEKSSITNPAIPRVFSGQDSRCRKPKGFLSSALFNNCCRTNLERPGGSRPFHGCTLDEVRLAAARRAAKTVYIGEYCSRRKRFIGCIETTETYCAFDDLLPRIIQQQGRAQLSDIVNGSVGSSIVKSPLNFDFYSGTGGWATGVESNGLEVKPWTQPSYCSDTQTALAHLEANPGALECIGKTDAYFAVCEKTGACGPLPIDPFDKPLDSKWLVIPVDATTNKTSGTTPYLNIVGACDTNTAKCNYEAQTLPAGMAGSAFVTVPASVAIYAAPEDVAAGNTDGTYVAGPTLLIGDTVVRPLSVVGRLSTTLPSNIGFYVSTDYGNTYTLMTTAIRSGNLDVTLPNGYRITGFCNAAGNVCDMKISGEVSVTAKPFGGPTGPDCSGFTFAQLSALDFGKMDLSEWISKITAQVQNAIAANITPDKFVSNTTSNYLATFRTGSVVTTAPSRADTARIFPRQEYGPFTAKLQVAGNWPTVYLDSSRNTDPVSSVQVDWGDCSAVETITPTVERDSDGVEVPNQFPMFEATHSYASPDEVPAACGGGENNINHQVRVTIFSASGSHSTKLRVVNVFKDFPTAIGIDEGDAGKTDINLNSNPVTVPSGPRVDMNTIYKD